MQARYRALAQLQVPSRAPRRRYRWPAYLTILALGCSAPAHQARYGTSLHEDPPADDQNTEPPTNADRTPLPKDIVQRAALPYVGYRVRDGKRISVDQLWNELIRPAAVCIGEHHDNPHDHYAEWQLISELARRAPMRGREVGLALEMFQQPYQYVIDAYLEGTLDERRFLEQTEYADRWGYDFSYYRPLLDAAKDRGLDVLAANAPREVTRAAAKGGVRGLSPKQREWFNRLDPDLDDAEHRARFDSLMEGHPSGGADPENMYLAQVIWDESMASVAAQWLMAERPMRLVVVVAGDAHCHRSAVPRRIQRRTEAQVVSVRPLVERADGDLEAELAGYDYAMLMQAGDHSPH